MSCFRGLFLTSAVLAVLSLNGVSNAGIVYDNVSASTGATSGGDAGITGANNGPLADSFSTGSGSSTLASIELVLRAITPTDGGSFTVSLYSNNPSGPVPGSLVATIATVSDSSLTTSLATYTYTPTTTVTLAGNTRYWIELGGNPTSTRWSFTSTNVGIGVANEYNYYAGASSANSTFTPYQMQVTVNPAAAAVPEPASLALCAIGIASVAIARRRMLRSR